ncbi:histidine phosphatase superfamily [Naematelia encephala]|uniref:Histidine phosphatase superfamily n=1 Tax=Naematelia encephala TaxID=71784 RepID=A0A1Y2B3D9_9TREE|nr:histidine phosphatase superfamily [Naematelia encephala]
MIGVVALALAVLTTTHASGLWTDNNWVNGKTFSPTNYTVVTGLFVQDEPTFNATGYNVLTDGFGLLDKSAKRWSNFTDYIHRLNREADDYTTYKVIYIARHGEGYHNQAESTYGTPAWNCYWSLQNTDGNITWGPDAVLTPNGVAQALAVNAAWKEQQQAGVPLPQKLYSSPMRRSTSTLNLTWSDILLNKGYIKEMFRESIGLHTCDQRSNLSIIQEANPGWQIDKSFTFHDELWNPIYEEQLNQQALRVRMLLNEIFATDPSTFISITAHSGVINSFFVAVGHQRFGVQTGGFVPVVVSWPQRDMSFRITKTAELMRSDRSRQSHIPQPPWQ